MTISETRTIRSKDIGLFAIVSGDENPIHRGEAKIAHGMLTASHISALFGKHFPGAVYIHQSLDFKRPVYPGDEITTSIEEVKRHPDKPIVTFSTVCTNGAGQIVLSGEAVLKLKED